MGVDTYKKRTFPLYSKNRYRKFEDLRIFFEELNSNIKDVEEMRKKRNEFTASENCQLQITRHLNKIVFSPHFADKKHTELTGIHLFTGNP